MASSIEVRGAQDFKKLSQALKAAGKTELRKELHKAMRDTAKPLVKEARDAAKETFPERGGLAAREAKIPFRAQVRTGATSGVRIVAPGKYVVGKTVSARGEFRHPVFAKKGTTRKDWTWVTQRVAGGEGWFEQRMAASAPLVRPELIAAMQRVIDKIIADGS